MRKILPILTRLLPCIAAAVVVLLATPGQAVAQERTITGRVTSSDDGQGFPGANIVVKGTTSGTVTDADGNFVIQVSSSQSVLVVSAIGFATEEIAVGEQTVINVSITPDITTLSEVVVVGYGTSKRSDVTGAISSVNQEQLRARPVVNATEALQGQAAGVDITSNERPGTVGEVRIRGVRSIGATNDPLYVVDGIPLMSRSGIETLNPLDIESMDVLKDASATAIYGSRGANGVIIVTTKKGKAGKTTLNYNGNVTVENIENRTDMMDAAEYIEWRRWSYYYLDPVNNPRGDEPTQAKDFGYFLGNTDPKAWENILRGWESGTWDGSKVQNTDWTGMVTQTSVTQIHNLSVSGGSDKVKTAASFGYLDNEGTMVGQEFKRYSTNLNVAVTPYEWFEMGVNLNLSYGIQQYGQSTTGSGGSSGPNSIFAAANANFPYAVPYDDNGVRIERPGGDDLVRTIVDEQKYSEDERRTLRALGSIYAQVNILPGLRYRVNFGPDFRNYKNGVFIDSKSVNIGGGPNYASLRKEEDISWTLDNLLYYDKAFGQHNLGITLLQTASSWNEQGNYMQGRNIPMPSQKWNALNNTNVSALNSWDSYLRERQLMSYMGRVTYGFNDKYLLTVSGRWDGASQLAEGYKWSFFPSTALAWRVDQESFMQDVTWVNSLKVRLGVGTTGNAAIDPYATKGGVVSLFYPFGNTPTAGYVPSETLISGGNLPLANPELGWERTTQYNLGFDFSLLQSRITGTVDMYTSNTKDLLLREAISPINGYTFTYSNIGKTRNSGIEVALTTLNVKGPVNWETTINAAWQKEEIVSLANGTQDDIANLWFIGESIGVIYGFESNGLWQESDFEEMEKFNANGHKFQAGMARPVDQNNDYKIDPNKDRVVIGNTRPRWTLGMNNTFTYKNFDLSIFIYGRLGYKMNTGGEAQLGRYVQRKIDYYTENNKDAEYQKPIYNVAGGDPYSSILGYRSASFLKIRFINLGYTFPKALVSKMRMQNLKVYVQAKNPGMIYSGIDWLDMDTGLSTWNRGFVFGINADF